MRFLKWLVIILCTLIVLYLVGPRARTVQLDTSPSALAITAAQADSYVSDHEAAYDIKPDNHAHIQWYDSIGQRTGIAMVYLHGMGASHMEGDPLHRSLAEHFRANLYLARLHAHGLQGDTLMLDFNREDYVNSAKDAIAIAKSLGDTVIVLSCSTGSTAALIASMEDDDIDAQLMYSPNIDIKDPSSALLPMPWGLQIARKVVGGKNRAWDAPEEVQKYWYTSYRLESLVELKKMLNDYMNSETFEKIDEPVMVAYYNASAEEQDEVVSVERIEEMYSQLGTEESLKRLVNCTRCGNHGMHNRFFSQDVDYPIAESIRFIKEVVQGQ